MARWGHAGLLAAKGAVKFDNALEALAARTYISEGVGLLAAGDKQVRQVLGISKGDEVADFLGVTQGGRYMIGEAKGSDVAHAVSQLDKTAAALLAKQGDVKFSAEIFLKKGQRFDDRNYKVVGTQLQRLNAKGRMEVVTVQGKAVTVRELEL